MKTNFSIASKIFENYFFGFCFYDFFFFFVNIKV